MSNHFMDPCFIHFNESLLVGKSCVPGTLLWIHFHCESFEMGDTFSLCRGRCDHRRSNFSLRQTASLYLRFRVGRHEMAADTNQTSNISILTSHPDEYFVHLPDKTICRLELEASVTLFCGVASLCVCALPLAFVFLTLIVCKIELSSFQCDVTTVLILIPYAREMLLLHSVVSPLLYVVRSREFSKALRRTLPRCFFVHQQRRCASPVELRNY